MRPVAFAVLLAATSLPALAPVLAQDNARLAARCDQLGALYDRYNGRRGEGSGGPNLARVGAAQDCEKGRYEQGIKTLEDLLKRNGIAVPPA